MIGNSAIVGVTEHGNSAIMVTISSDGVFLDRRTADLTTGLPTMPYHHQGSWAIGRYKGAPWTQDIMLADAIGLIEKVELAATQGAEDILETLSIDVGIQMIDIIMRECPILPDTIEERIRDNRAQTYADTVVYRQCLARAAKKRGWNVHWYDRDTLDINTTEITAMGKVAGPPWQAKHKQAAAAAIDLLKELDE